MTSLDVANRPRHILKLSNEEKRQFLNSFDNVFSDIDGVIWNLNDPITGAPAGFTELKSAGKSLTFITNNSVRTVQQAIDKFKEHGLELEEKNIVHPAQNIVDYLKSIEFKGLIYLIGSQNLRDLLTANGFQFIDGPTIIINESYRELASHVFDNQPVRAVIIDVDFNLSSTKLIKATVYLRADDCLLIAGATDALLPVSSSMSILGPGPFQQVVADASKRHMITLGKPGRELAQLLIKRFALKNTKRALMIGDMIEQDIGFGKECDFQTLLVLSGGSSLQDMLSEKNAKRIPDYYADSMADFVQFMQDLNKSKV